MISNEGRALARLHAVALRAPVVVRQAADVAPRPDAGWLALATMPADGRIWSGVARLPGGEVRDLSVLEPRNAALERDGLLRLGRYLDDLTARSLGEGPGDYPQLIVPDGETTRALQLVRERFRADPDPALRRLALVIGFFLDVEKLAGADAYLDLRRLLCDHAVFPLAPAEERHLGKLLACLETEPADAAALAARRTCLPDAVADRLSDLLIERSRAIQRGQLGRWTAAHEAAVHEALRAHATNLLDLLARGLDAWAALDLTPVEPVLAETLAASYRHARSRWLAEDPPYSASRPAATVARHHLLEREAAAERRACHLQRLDHAAFAEAVLAGEAARATLVEHVSPRLVRVRIGQPNLRLRHGDPLEARNVDRTRFIFQETEPAADLFALRVEAGVRRVAALAPGTRLELVRAWDGQLTRKRHQCLRLWRQQPAGATAPRLGRPRAADPAGWYAARQRARAGSGAVHPPERPISFNPHPD